MSTVLINDSTLTDIGDAIRSKNGSSDLYYPSDMATAITNIPSGGLPPITVPTLNRKSIRDDWPSMCDFSEIFSTQEEMLVHLFDIISEKGAETGTIANNWVTTPIWRDTYGRWIPLKDLGISIPSSLNIGSQWASLGLSSSVIQDLYNNNLVFGCYSDTTNYLTSGNGRWFIIYGTYIIGCTGSYVGYMTNTHNVLYTEA